MRMSLPAANPCLAIALVLALAACRQEAPPEAPAPVDAPSATASDQAIAAPGPAASTGDEALEGDVIASTNEPFWQASVTGATLTLRGIGSERSLAVTASEVAGDTRSIRASDASGVVELQVIAGIVIGGTSLAGGRGSIVGTFIGVVLIGVINVGLSLLGSARMRLRPYPPPKGRSADTRVLELPRRSAYLIEGPARWQWQHCISETSELRYSISLRTPQGSPALMPTPTADQRISPFR